MLVLTSVPPIDLLAEERKETFKLRKDANRVVGAQLTPDTMIPHMLQSEDIWIVLRTTEIMSDSKKSLRCLHPRSRILGGVGCPRLSGVGIFFFLPWLARLVGLSGGHVTAGWGSGWTDDGRVVRDFKLEPIAREV